MRLIDADKLIEQADEYIKKWGNPSTQYKEGLHDGATRILHIVDRQPTAYDVDKVLKQLSEEVVYIDTESDAQFVELMEMFRIVKRGGIDEVD